MTNPHGKADLLHLLLSLHMSQKQSKQNLTLLLNQPHGS